LKLHPFDPIGFHGIDLQAVCLSGRLAKEMPWAARRVRWAKVLRRIGGLLGQAAKNRVVHVQALFSLRFPDWLRLRKLGSFAEISLSVGLVWLMRNRAAPMGSSANGDGSIRRVCLAKTPCALSRARSAEQPSIVLFMFKHCFHYDFTIGFVCGSWVRLRKASLSVGFVWLIRNRAAPTGSSANWRWIHPSGSFGQNRRAAARPSRLFAHTEDCAGSLLAKRSFASPQHQLDKSGCERLGIRRSGAI
jgi:hypothetical protein